MLYLPGKIINYVYNWNLENSSESSQYALKFNRTL